MDHNQENNQKPATNNDQYRWLSPLRDIHPSIFGPEMAQNTDDNPMSKYRLHTIYRKSSTYIGTPIYTPKHKLRKRPFGQSTLPMANNTGIRHEPFNKRASTTNRNKLAK